MSREKILALILIFASVITLKFSKVDINQITVLFSACLAVMFALALPLATRKEQLKSYFIGFVSTAISFGIIGTKIFDKFVVAGIYIFLMAMYFFGIVLARSLRNE